MPEPNHHISYAEQLAEVNREIGLRERLYPKWVSEHRLRQHDADRTLNAMRAVRDSIANLLKQEQGA